MIPQLISARGVAINTTLAALTAATGDSLQIPNFDPGKTARLLQVWSDVQVAGTLRIRSPKMHDNVNGIRIDTVISDPSPLLPWGFGHRLYPGDILNVELAGSAVAGDVETVHLLIAYDELPGQTGRFLTADAVQQRMSHLLTVENTIATDTSGQYSGAEAINAEIDQFQLDSDYAILGYKVDTECGAVRYRAPDFANVGIGGPGVETDPLLTCSWFVELSRKYNAGLVPVFAGANKSAVLVDVIQDENGADVTVTTILARLNKG